VSNAADSQPATSNGTFLGWNMVFWGTTVDPAKARKFEVPTVDNILPVHLEPPAPARPTTTKQLTKPTAHLPGDHGEAPGENHKPAFSTGATGPTATATPHPTADEGWFPGMANLVSSQKWFFGAIGGVAVFGVGMGIFFWRRRRAQMSNYSSLPAGDDMSMNTLLTGNRPAPNASRPTRELYDAFGEVSDDEDELGPHPANRVSKGVGFHSGFLDDDEPSTAGGATPRYRDEPDSSKHHPERRASSPSGSGSGESWEHASAS
jgi:kexin